MSNTDEAAIDWQATPPGDWQALAERHGTPLYLFDADAVQARVRQVREAFGGRAGVYFAVKANPNLGLLQALRGTVDGLDIASGGELAQALLAGHDAAAMSFAGPAKTDDELRQAIQAGVGAIAVESLAEIDRCAALAHRLDRPARLLLRVNPAAPPTGYGVLMGGRALQFGIDEALLPQAVRQLRRHGAALRFEGLHAYVGSQCVDAQVVARTSTDLLRIASELAGRHGLPCPLVNLGGGFGVAQQADGRWQRLDVQALGEALRPALQDWQARHEGGRVVFELGRFLCAEAGLYLTRVVDAKVSRGTAYVVCDGGMNHQLAAAGLFGTLPRAQLPQHPLLNLSRPQAAPLRCQVAGPTCHPADLLGVDVMLPEPGPGDLLGVAMSGSYGLTASPLLFLGHATPVELVRQHGRVSVGRRRHELTDFN